MKRSIFFFRLGTAALTLSFMVVLLAMGLVSCATTVPIDSVKTPTIDTSGIKKLAIKPFVNQSGVGGTVGAQLPQYLTGYAEQQIRATGKFEIVAANDSNADGVFTGVISNIASQDSQEQRTRKDKDGNAVSYTHYTRKVTVEFSYGIVSSRTNVSIGTVGKSGSTSDSSDESASKLADTVTLAKRIVDREMKNLQKDIVPYIVSEKRKLMKETSKDKVVKEKMKEAMTLVKNRNYELAIQRFDAISAEHGSAAAQNNAGVLRESIASSTAARADLERLDAERSGLAEKVIKEVVETINSKLPPKSNITLMETGTASSRDRTILNNVVDQVSATLVQEGKLKIIDRTNQALVNAEQQFQMSGSVSDDSIVSIGRQLGIQYFVFCGISGEQSGRKFVLRVLSVETSQVVHQANFEI